MNRMLLLALVSISSLGTAAAGSVRLAQASTAAPTFAALDTNHDGKISVHEASANDALFVAFKKLDTNRDGDLTPTEFAAFTPTG